MYLRRATLVFATVLSTASGASAGAAPATRCLSARIALAAGIVASTADFVPAACSGAAVAAFRYDDASRIVRLSRPLVQGEIVSTFAGYGDDMALPGQTLRLQTVSGPVRIEREVEALQSARPGQRLFVRSADGQVLSVRYEGGAK